MFRGTGWNFVFITTSSHLFVSLSNYVFLLWSPSSFLLLPCLFCHLRLLSVLPVMTGCVTEVSTLIYTNVSIRLLFPHFPLFYWRNGGGNTWRGSEKVYVIVQIGTFGCWKILLCQPWRNRARDDGFFLTNLHLTMSWQEVGVNVGPSILERYRNGKT